MNWYWHGNANNTRLLRATATIVLTTTIIRLTTLILATTIAIIATLILTAAIAIIATLVLATTIILLTRGNMIVIYIALTLLCKA